MCRMYLIVSQETENIFSWLVSYPNSLFAQSMNDSTSRPNADGWGIAWLDSGGNLLVQKSPEPAFIDPDFKMMAQKTRSSIVLSHVRRGSIGRNVYNNTHPYFYNNWLFAHNGNIPTVKTDREGFKSMIDFSFLTSIKGDTDSELFFYLCLSRLADIPMDDDEKIVRNLGGMVKEIKEMQKSDIDNTALNFMLVGKEIQIGYRFNRPLCYLEKSHKILVASEPINNYNLWQEIAEDSMFVIRNRKIKQYSIHNS